MRFTSIIFHGRQPPARAASRVAIDLDTQLARAIRKEMFYLTTHSTHFIYGYMASHIIMVKYHSDSVERKPAAATWATLSV